jgi:hypothetical protein
VGSLYAARERNKINLAVATKLNAAIEQYENAGIDMSAAQKGIDEIFELLQRANIITTGKAPGPVILPRPERAPAPQPETPPGN